MAIESSRLSLITTTEARRDPVVAISTSEPPNSYLARTKDSATVFIPVDQVAREEGQIAAVVDEITGEAGMRCVVSVGGELVWVRVSFGGPESKFSAGKYSPKLGSIGLVGG